MILMVILAPEYTSNVGSNRTLDSAIKSKLFEVRIDIAATFLFCDLSRLVMSSLDKKFNGVSNLSKMHEDNALINPLPVILSSPLSYISFVLLSNRLNT